MNETPAYASFDELFGLEPEERTVEIFGVGSVLLRELRADELLACQLASISEDPIAETVSFDAAKNTMLRVAASLEQPSLGATLDERLLGYDKLRALPSRAYQQLTVEVEKLTSVDLRAVAQLSQIIDSVPFLFEILEVLAEKRGWLNDLEGKTLKEFKIWAAFHRLQRQRVDRALAQLQGG